MANQPEQPIFDPGVYQLETTDPVLGGIGGLSNIPLLSLTNRTSWLKQEVDTINATLPMKAPLESPALTGTPTAPTQSLESEATRIATTAFARGVVSGRMEKTLSGSSNVTLTDSEAGNGLLLFSGSITAAINVVVPGASRRWIVHNGTSGGFTITLKTAAAAGVAVPPGMALELWCDGSVVRTVAASAWATPRKIALNGPVTGDVTLDGSADVAMQTAVVAATDAQPGIVELATNAEAVAGTDAARAVTPAGLAARTATTDRRGLVELATEAEVDAGADTERAVTPAGVKRRIDTRAVAARTITAGDGLTGGGDLSADRALALGTPGTLSGSTPNAVTATSHTHAVAVATDAVSGVIELATFAEVWGGIDNERAVTPATLVARTAHEDRVGLVELATATEVQSGIDNERAVTPAGLSARLATTDRRGIVELATAAEAAALADSQRAITAAALEAALGELFAGSIAYFHSSTAPAGWLKANGAAVSRTTYARLFARLGSPNTGDGFTTFNLPDLRGEFLRGWDDGRGVDAGRTFGSQQTHETLAHRHLMFANAAGNSWGLTGDSNAAANTTMGSSDSEYVMGRYWDGAAYPEATLGLTSNSGGTETRPRNVALLACIKT